MEGKLPLHTDGDVIALYHNWQYSEQTDVFFDQQRQGSKGIVS
jgi:hypothetical protein